MNDQWAVIAVEHGWSLVSPTGEIIPVVLSDKDKAYRIVKILNDEIEKEQKNG